MGRTIQSGKSTLSNERSLGLGIESRDSSIRLKFRYNGEVIRERLAVNGKSLAPTPANLKYATRVAAEIRRRIEIGNFEIAEFFPTSKRAEHSKPQSFGALADLWLQSKGQLEDATREQYRNAIVLWKRILGANTPIDKLTFQVLSSKIGKHPWASGKTANNYLIALRGVFALEFHGRRAADNPMIGIRNLKVIRKLPDPLTVDERDQILDNMLERYDERIYAYFAFAFFTGMRPEEVIALRWGDVDWHNETIRVQRVRTFRGSEREGSKTHSERDVDLVPEALQALNTMKPYTFLKAADVFENPVTGKPWHDDRAQRDTYWAPTIKLLGIRSRRAYHTRHTYATAALMAGVNPAYIARQLGHASTQMLFQKYAKWIDGADKGAEKRKLGAALSSPGRSQKVPKRSQSAGDAS